MHLNLITVNILLLTILGNVIISFDFCRLNHNFISDTSIRCRGLLSFIEHMESRYNRVASNEQSRNLKKWLKLYGLEHLFEDSKEGVLKTYNSCKFRNVISL